jgi:hypothetical protein
VRSPNPRKAYLHDLASQIQELQTKGHAVLIMMDANETINDDNELSQWRDKLDLIDIHR